LGNEVIADKGYDGVEAWGGLSAPNFSFFVVGW
jgi:hypothetical protein